MDVIYALIGGVGICAILAYLLEFLSFGLIPNGVSFLIFLFFYAIYLSYLILNLFLKIIEHILNWCGFNVDLDFKAKYINKKELRKERNKLNKRISLQDSIKKEIEKIIEEYKLVPDVSLLKNFEPSNISYYMDNEEKYSYVMGQEQRVKDIFNEYKHLFEITNEGFYINEHFYEDEHTFKNVNDDGILYPYKEEDLSFFKLVYPIKPEHISFMVRRRHVCYNVIKESLSQSTIEAITTKKGYDGEKNVAKFLNLYNDNYIVLNNIRVELDGQSSESDFIIICDKGVFALEVKNHGNINSTIKISSDGRWSTVKNGRKEAKDNVSAQNNRHCAINQTIYNKKLKDNGYDGDYIKCNSIIVIANDKVEIENESMNAVLRTSEIITYIENLKVENKLSKELQHQIKDILLANNLPPKKYPVINLEINIKEALIEYERLSHNLRGYRKIKSTYRKYIE